MVIGLKVRVILVIVLVLGNDFSQYQFLDCLLNTIKFVSYILCIMQQFKTLLVLIIITQLKISVQH